MGITTEDDSQNDIEMKPIENGNINDATILEDETSLMNEEAKFMPLTNDEVRDQKEGDKSVPQLKKRSRTHDRVLKVLNRGSIFVIGLAILVAGGVSSNFHPYVDPVEYENCTVTDESSHLNETRTFQSILETKPKGLSLMPTAVVKATSFDAGSLTTKTRERRLISSSSTVMMILISPTPSL